MGGKVIYHVLASDASVAALVSTRIYPNIADTKATLPYIVYEVMAASRYQTNDGYTGLGQFTYNIRCFSSSYGGAKALAQLARLALDNLKNNTYSGQTIQMITCLGNDEGFEYRDADAEEAVYEVGLDFDVFVTEATS